jgi:hypothetical protein
MEEKNFVKITNALYSILDRLPDADPLKYKAKEKVLAILENFTLVWQSRGWVSLQKEKASAALWDDISILENYLKIGQGQGWIDGMNFLIISKEYADLKGTLKPPFGVVSPESLPQGQDPFTKEAKNKIFVKPVKPQFSESKPSKPVVTSHGSLSSKALTRQAKILEILAKREKAQVADLIKGLPNITKRTIRRDLRDLLKEGKITRIGSFNQVFYQSAKRIFVLTP